MEMCNIMWCEKRAKKYNTWINECDLTETLKNKLKNRKFNNKHRLQTMYTRTNPSMEKKVIDNQNDWLSFYHIIEVPIIKTFEHNGITYEDKCDSIESMYTFLKHEIMKNTQGLYKQVKNNMCKSKIFIIHDIQKYWTIINTRILYHAVVEVLVHNQPILCKLDNNNCMYVDEKGLGITTYTTILMLLREQRRLYKKQHMSIHIATLINPIPNIMGNL